MPDDHAHLPTHELTRCTVCGSARLGPAGFAYLFRDTRFPAARCSRCGLVFLVRQPTAAGLRQLYDADYFEADYHCGHDERSYFAAEEEQLAAAGVLLGMIEEHVAPGRILEVGCAGGYFLRAARDRGWSPVGVEISGEAAGFARDRLGLEVHTGTVESADLEDGSLDAAYMGDVLEHMPDPVGALRRLHALLRPGGGLLIAGPITVNSIDRRLGLVIYRALRRSKTLLQPPYHLTEFTPSTLAAALTRTGFRVLRVRQSKLPPSPHNPRRRPPLEHAVKLLLDAGNWVVTRATGRLGDRAIVLASRVETGGR